MGTIALPTKVDRYTYKVIKVTDYESSLYELNRYLDSGYEIYGTHITNVFCTGDISRETISPIYYTLRKLINDDAK